jgi:hypothetical protein
MINLRVVPALFCLAWMIAAPSVSACELDVGYISEADFLASVDLTGLTYDQQIATRDEALAQFRRDRQATRRAGTSRRDSRCTRRWRRRRQTDQPGTVRCHRQIGGDEPLGI